MTLDNLARSASKSSEQEDGFLIRMIAHGGSQSSQEESGIAILDTARKTRRWQRNIKE